MAYIKAPVVRIRQRGTSAVISMGFPPIAVPTTIAWTDGVSNWPNPDSPVNALFIAAEVSVETVCAPWNVWILTSMAHPVHERVGEVKPYGFVLRSL